MSLTSPSSSPPSPNALIGPHESRDKVRESIDGGTRSSQQEHPTQKTIEPTLDNSTGSHVDGSQSPRSQTDHDSAKVGLQRRDPSLAVSDNNSTISGDGARRTNRARRFQASDSAEHEGPTHESISTTGATASPDFQLEMQGRPLGQLSEPNRVVHEREHTPMFLPFHKHLQQQNFDRIQSMMNSQTLLDVDPAQDVLEQVFAPASSGVLQHKLDVLEVIQGWEGDLKYRAALDTGALASAAESTQGVSRALLGNRRPFKMYVHLKNPKTPLLLLQRPFKLFQNYIIVRSLHADGHPGDVVGHVKKKFSLSRRKFIVTDEEDKLLYEISSTRISRVFGIYNDQGMEIGRIKKKWTGLMREIYTDSDSFAIRFPLSATGTEKCLLFSALFLIDYTYYDGANKGNMGTTYY